MVSQAEMLKSADVDQIAHGISLPIDLIKKHCLGSRVITHNDQEYALGPGIIWNIGSGGEMEKINRLKRLGLLVINSDINPVAVRNEVNRYAFSFYSSADSYGDQMGWMGLAMLEGVGSVWMGGLLENMMQDWGRAIETANICLEPEGHLLIGGVVRAEIEHAKMKALMGEIDYLEYQKRWIERYKRAVRLDPDRYGYGSFPVAKPGKEKKREWGTVQELENLILSGEYERDAQHMDPDEIVRLAEKMGLRLVEKTEEIWPARTEGDYYPGYVLVFKKGERYLLDPLKREMSYQEGAQFNIGRGKARLRANYGSPAEYYGWYKNSLISNCEALGITIPQGLLGYLDCLIEGNGDDGGDLGAWPDPPEFVD